ncbi:hypothetical protein SRHO_G00117040 [Serrasalmus rhombeus]
MEMKMSLVLGLVMLIAVSSDATLGTGGPDLCCFDFAHFKIPEKNIIQVVKTHSSCPKPGYVVTTLRGQFCKEEVVLH